MITAVLILHGKLPAAIALKQAMERTPRFEVHPFTTPEAAVEFIHEHPQDAALVDFSSLGATAADAVIALRQVQPDLFVIAAPSPGDSLVADLGINATLNSAYRAADLMQLLDAMMSSKAARPTPDFTIQPQDASRTSMLEHVFDDSTPPMPDTLPEHGSLEDVLQQIGHEDFGFALDESLEEHSDSHAPGAEFDALLHGLSPVDRDRPARTDFDALVDSLKRAQPSRSRMMDFIIRGGVDDAEEDIEEQKRRNEQSRRLTNRYGEEAVRNYRQLAQEEPPMPTFDEGGTVSDLVSGAHDRGFQKVLAILRGEEIESHADDSSGAVKVLGTNFDYSSSGVIDTPRPQISQFDFEDVPAADDSPARAILEKTLEQSISNGEFSLDDLLTSIERQFAGSRPTIKPLSPHVRADAERRWREALAARQGQAGEAQLPPPPSDVPEGYYAEQTTRPSRAQQFESHPELLETEWLDSPARPTSETMALRQPPRGGSRGESPPPPAAPESLPEELPDETPDFLAPLPTEEASSFEEEAFDFSEISAVEEDIPPAAVELVGVNPPEPEPELTLEYGEDSDWYDLHTEDFNTQFELMAAFELTLPDGAQAQRALYTESAPERTPAGRAALAAVQLTDIALETTAEAILLLRDGAILAQAGRMSADELLSLQPAVLAASSTPQHDTRVQFITQPDTGRDYMLYACRTEEDLLLALIFKGATSMSDIRKQGSRLVKALSTVPEFGTLPAPAPAAPAPTAPPKPAPPAPGPETGESYTYVWLLRDPEALITAPVAQAISAGMRMQLSEAGWLIDDLQVNEDYVYVYGEAPGDAPPFRVVRDLKRRSAEIARAQNAQVQTDSLWADSYLIVAPGRALDVEEIQQFINFERM
ncbi:MAG: transposase [Anaerolineae bacterium]|nr:transposase [Anaerolineae bacterium]NUQ05491.1 transposase [Anaerolineae bacterium]